MVGRVPLDYFAVDRLREPAGFFGWSVEAKATPWSTHRLSIRSVFSAGWPTKMNPLMHGRPHERRHSLQIEINRRLYMDESTLEKIAGFAALQANLTSLLEGMRTFIVARAGHE